VQDNPYHPSASTLNSPDSPVAEGAPQADAVPRWFTRTLAVLGIGGGALGIAITAWLAVTAGPNLALLIFVPVIAAYVFGIHCGVAALRRSPRYLSRNAWFYWLQLPVLSTPAFVYSFVSGLQVVVGVAPPRLIWNFYLGSTFQLFIGAGAPLVLGINLVAVAILVLIRRMEARSVSEDG
jgi:hypothetical protein